jgi:hypothetical protein
MSSLPIPPEDYEVDVITSDINEPNFYAILPNIVEELLTDAYERSLYWHYRKITGDVGTCFETTATTAKKSGMGVTKLREVRQCLHDKGLIRLIKRQNKKTKEWDSYHIRIVPVWHLNNFYVWSNNPEKYAESLRGISPDEVGVLRHAVEGISPRGDNKESFKKNAVKKSVQRANAVADAIPFPVPGLTAKVLASEENIIPLESKTKKRDEIFEAVLKGSYSIDYEAAPQSLDRSTRGRVNLTCQPVKARGFTPEQVRAFYADYANWRPGLSVTRDGVRLAADIVFTCSTRRTASRTTPL